MGASTLKKRRIARIFALRQIGTDTMRVLLNDADDIMHTGSVDDVLHTRCQPTQKHTSISVLDPRLTHALGILPRANPPVV